MNQITLQPTIFINYPQKSLRRIETYGYRMYDDEGQTYFSRWKSIPDNSLEVLRQALEDADEVAGDMFSYVLEHQCGMNIGDEWYDWDEISHLFE